METIQDLFAQTLIGDYKSEEAWAAVHALRLDGSREVFEHAADWCEAGDPRKRARAAGILGQLRGYAQPEMSYELIVKMVENEQDAGVLDSAISALGHLANPKAIPIILRYQDHPERDVRFAVAFALGCFPNDPESIGALMKLTSDSSSGVRDWAVFGLGVMGDADSPEIREALLRCLNDADEDVREEAAVGLGKRRDQRLIPKLLAMLDDAGLTVRVADAAVALLALDRVPEEWGGAEYKDALRLKFNTQQAAP